MDVIFCKDRILSEDCRRVCEKVKCHFLVFRPEMLLIRRPDAVREIVHSDIFHIVGSGRRECGHGKILADSAEIAAVDRDAACRHGSVQG